MIIRNFMQVVKDRKIIGTVTRERFKSGKVVYYFKSFISGEWFSFKSINGENGLRQFIEKDGCCKLV